jgi:hypothetical protein
LEAFGKFSDVLIAGVEEGDKPVASVGGEVGVMTGSCDGDFCAVGFFEVPIGGGDGKAGQVGGEDTWVKEET